MESSGQSMSLGDRKVGQFYDYSRDWQITDRDSTGKTSLDQCFFSLYGPPAFSPSGEVGFLVTVPA